MELTKFKEFLAGKNLAEVEQYANAGAEAFNEKAAQMVEENEAPKLMTVQIAQNTDTGLKLPEHIKSKVQLFDYLKEEKGLSEKSREFAAAYELGKDLPIKTPIS